MTFKPNRIDGNRPSTSVTQNTFREEPVLLSDTDQKTQEVTNNININFPQHNGKKQIFTKPEQEQDKIKKKYTEDEKKINEGIAILKIRKDVVVNYSEIQETDLP